ncbi:MAG: insulinase family protein [Thiomicrospira sp.]|uniref:M16 family metallopeptidase n=1 Tax=Thiomicrospira sp. TaxID=935 RepID=UPI0019F4A758|nr:pitrilysin family protein [Thiomicrospira sp.]MBE0493189.1 insulinase family protein [Thiomicrospira sp.]
MKKIMHVLVFAIGSIVFSLSQASIDIQTWQTAKGVKVLFVEAPQLPMVDIEVSFDAGSARDASQPGLANLTSALLSAGTKQKDEQQISIGFNNLGAQFGGQASRDSASFNLRSLTRENLLSPALDLFAEVLAQPTFPKAIFERDQARLIQALKQREEQPNQVASLAFWQALYADHPYAHPTAGNIESVQAIKPRDLKAFYQRYYVAKNAQVSIVGAIDRKQAEQIAEHLTRSLKTGEPAPALLTPKPLQTAQTEVVDFSSAQTHYMLGQLGVERGHPDYYALFLGNHLLGGSGFGSLLVEEVREKRGLVYSVYSYFAPMRVAGPWLIGLSTQNSQALEADQVVKQTLQDFMTDFSDEKLTDIKSNLIGGWPLRLDSNSKILGYISMIGFYDLPLDYLDAFPRHIEALTKQDVLDAWQRHIQADKMLTLMVGQPE